MAAKRPGARTVEGALEQELKADRQARSGARRIDGRGDGTHARPRARQPEELSDIEVDVRKGHV
jgi:hypothetical protein